MEARNIPQRRWRPDDRRHWSGVRGRRLRILAGFQPSEPHVRFVSRDVAAGCSILGPGGKCIVSQLLATFLALDVLLNGLAHQRIG
jgi:hypothetical protein